MAQQVIPDTWTLRAGCLSFRCKFAEFGTSLTGYLSWCAVWTRCLQLINNILLTTILAKKFGISMEEAVEESMVARLTEEFTAAMAEYAQSFQILASSQTRFKNRDD